MLYSDVGLPIEKLTAKIIAYVHPRKRYYQ